ncbi:MAG: amino acid adenylation domain-containing protein [Pseudomonadota bacterium]
MSSQSPQSTDPGGEIWSRSRDSDPNYPAHSPELTITDVIARATSEFADKPAISFHGKTLRFDELDALSNRIANYLLTNHVSPQQRVGLALARSEEMIACLLGIIKAGCAYVPLDPTYPQERLSIMQSDADLAVTIAHKVDNVKWSTNDGAVFWEEIKQEVEGHAATAPDVDISPDHSAYIIFTSGSTGRPKGVDLPHRALANLIDWQLKQPYFKPQARVLQYSSVSFDVSFQEIATTLASGGCLYLINDDERRDPRALINQLIKHKIERLFLPYVALRSLIEIAMVKNQIPDSLREWITAGEQLIVDDTLRTFFSNISGAVLDNQYGPSETHVITAHCLSGGPWQWPKQPPIGTAIQNCSALVLDDNGNQLPIGERGELYLGGRNLAMGYFMRSDQTAKSFVERSIDGDRRRMYQTGDLAFVDENGQIHFCGRLDHQIKIRGHRVEPSDIDEIGKGLEGVAQSFTHLHRSENHEQHLATYFVAAEDTVVDEQAFKDHLAAHLPGYMVPAFVMRLDNIPFTPSGKLDVLALPKPQGAHDPENSAKVNYHSETESQLAGLWSEILNISSVPRDVSYFDLGGDSLNAVKLFLRIEEVFDLDLPLATLARSPSLAKLAMELENANDAEHAKFRSLQILRKGHPDFIPLLLVHSGLGNVLHFEDLAQALDPRQPVYAFQWSGWDGDASETTIEEMASNYKAELYQICPNGPYRVGGHCVGGLIAIELCNQLIADGHAIDGPLLVADGLNVHSSSYLSTEPNSSIERMHEFSKLVDDLNAENVSKTNLASAALPGGIISKIRRVPIFLSLLRTGRNLHKIARIKMALRLRRKVPIGDRSYYCYLAQVGALKVHKSRGYTGNVQYFRSSCVLGQDLGLHGWWNDRFLGFKELCEGGFSYEILGGDHRDVVQHQMLIEFVRDSLPPKPIQPND